MFNGKVYERNRFENEEKRVYIYIIWTHLTYMKNNNIDNYKSKIITSDDKNEQREKYSIDFFEN